MFKTDLFLRHKTLYVFLLCLFAFSYTAKAQEQNTPKQDTIQRYKWEIATDLLWLIDKNTVPRFSVFGRKNITTKNGKHSAWRLRVGGDFSNTTWQEGRSIDGSFPEDRDIRNREIIIRPGFEFQRTKGKFQLYYGLDVHFRWAKEKADYFNRTGTIVPPSGVIYTDIFLRSQTWESGLGTFIGIKYFVTPRWAISTETNLDFIYTKLNLDSPEFLGINSNMPGILVGGRKTNRQDFNININPMSVLQISYFF